MLDHTVLPIIRLLNIPHRRIHNTTSSNQIQLIESFYSLRMIQFKSQKFLNNTNRNICHIFKISWRCYVSDICIFQDICQSAVLYTDILHSKMKKNSYFDDEGQFDVHKPVGYTACLVFNTRDKCYISLCFCVLNYEGGCFMIQMQTFAVIIISFSAYLYLILQLCTCLNDLEYIRRTLIDLPDKLNLAQVRSYRQSKISNVIGVKISYNTSIPSVLQTAGNFYKLDIFQLYISNSRKSAD